MNLLCLRPYPDIEAKFILMVFRSPYFKDEIRPFIKNAVNQASINIRNLSSVHLHLPPVPEQHRIVAKIEEIFTQLDAIAASLKPTCLAIVSVILTVAKPYMRLPDDNLVYDFLLFACCATQIDTSGFKAFMSHEVGKKGDVVKPLEEVLGKPMTE